MSSDREYISDGLAREFRRQAGIAAARLREAADEIERHAATIHSNLHDGLPDYLYGAVEITNDLRRAATNSNLDAVIRAATDADRYCRSFHRAAPSSPLGTPEAPK